VFIQSEIMAADETTEVLSHNAQRSSGSFNLAH